MYGTRALLHWSLSTLELISEIALAPLACVELLRWLLLLRCLHADKLVW